MSGNQVIGVGSGAVAGVGGGIIATQLPQTGPFSIDSVAIALGCALIVWGVSYLAFRKASR